ncbi:hypothetical protein RA280_32050 [Cupriavidus sp. CV2]|uniref:hypothetical protein n=1 Tax=Cupriavidus ulmosensis TaxID=3065913 RepID=UPI00296B4724|nr:hypothetical protein [Cupriavidus sp. CV2]MDW3686294.1 hypothetical protein [Cupriavidus sp. CV2]
MLTVSTLVAEHQAALQYMHRFGDAVIVAICGIAVGTLSFPEGLQGAAPVHGYLTALCAISTLLVFRGGGLYGSWRGRRRALLALRTFAAWTLVSVLGLATAFLMHQEGALSRLWWMSWFAAVAVALVGSRILLYRMLGNVRQHGINAKRVVIFGYGPLGHELYQRAQRIRDAGYEVVGIYDNEGGALPPGVTLLKSMPEICEFIRSQGVREIWLTLPMAACRDVYDVVSQFRNDLIDVRWVPDIMSAELLGQPFSDFLGMPVIDLNSPPVSGVAGLLKARFDRRRTNY